MGKVVVITGVTRGLGRAMAEGIAAKGHTVVGCGRSAEGVRSLGQALQTPHRFDVLDVTRDREVAAWAESVLDQFGPPDLLLNNAALMNAPAKLWEITAEEFDALTSVNINGVANVIRHLVPAMVAKGSGVIVNFSSGWGRSTSPEVAPYCGTKWAIEGLTRAMAQELPRGMAAVPLNPGVIDTDMLQLCFGDRASGFPDARAWARTAVPFLLALGPKDNGKPLSAP